MELPGEAETLQINHLLTVEGFARRTLVVLNKCNTEDNDPDLIRSEMLHRLASYPWIERLFADAKEYVESLNAPDLAQEDRAFLREGSGMDEVETALGALAAEHGRTARLQAVCQEVRRASEDASSLWEPDQGSGYSVVHWYAETAPSRHHSALSPYGPIPSEWARSMVAIRIEAEAINGVRLPHHLVKSCVGREGSASLLGLDLLECFDLLKEPHWKIPETSPGNDPLAQFPKTAMSKWRRTCELSIGAGTAPGCPSRRLIAQFGTDSDWSEDMWGQATMQAHSLLDQAVARSRRRVERFYPGSLYVAGVRDVHDNVELLVDGVGRPFERRMPTEEVTLRFAWGRQDSTD